MGRTVPSESFRLDTKMSQWENYSRALMGSRRDAYEELAALLKLYRTAISEAGESDITVPILLSMIIEMKTELNELRMGMGPSGTGAANMLNIKRGDWDGKHS